MLPAGSWKPAPNSSVCRREQRALRSYLWADGTWGRPGETWRRTQSGTVLGQKALSFTFGQDDEASHSYKPLLFSSLIGLLLMLGLLHQRLKQGPGRGCKGSREEALIEKPRGQRSSKLP